MTAEAARLDAGSFRDRTARVFRSGDRVFRALAPAALREWNAVSASHFFQRATAEGAIVRSWPAAPASVPVPDDVLPECAAVVEHEPIPFVSYPYEWSFSMLKDAALLQLDLLLSALDEDITLKDASAFNVQWKGAAPVFVDVASFVRWKPGEPWVGYRQFCQMFLYPLLLQAYRGVAFQPLMRGSLEGIDADTCRRLLRTRDCLRGGVLVHVHLQARAQAAYARSDRDVRRDLRAAGFNTALIKANAMRLRRLVAALEWTPARSTWSEYTSCGHYQSADADAKLAFVRSVTHSRQWQLVWDLGCNTGTYSRIAAESAQCVVALDADHLAVERLYLALKAEGNRVILPLVGNITDPAPDLGWRNLERKRLELRGSPDLILCLALIHHLVIGGNVPLGELMEWLRGLGGNLIIEFVTREDPMVATLLRNKDDQYTDYDLATFERELGSRFRIEQRQPLSSGTRVLYHARAMPSTCR